MTLRDIILKLYEEQTNRIDLLNEDIAATEDRLEALKGQRDEAGAKILDLFKKGNELIYPVSSEETTDDYTSLVDVVDRKLSQGIN